MSPQDTAVFWTEYVIRNGNVLRSPAVNLHWWQLELLDVYGFLLLITLFTIWITILIIKILLNYIFSIGKKAKNPLLHKKIK